MKILNSGKMNAAVHAARKDILLILLFLLCFSNQVGAQVTSQFFNDPWIIKTIEQDLSVRQAQKKKAAMEQEVHVLLNQNQEVQARLTTQRRETVDTGTLREWNLSVEKTIRLPGKAGVIQELATVMQREADATVGEAKHEAALDLLKLWMAWMVARQQEAIERDDLAQVERTFELVNKRVKAGEAAKIDLLQANSEIIERKRKVFDSQIQMQRMLVNLNQRFPGMAERYHALPDFVFKIQSKAKWLEQVREHNDSLEILRMHRRRNVAQAEKLRQDQIPDPSIGLFRASEMGGREKITGISISIPISWGIREARQRQAALSSDVTQFEVQIAEQKMEQKLDLMLMEIEAGRARIQLAQELAVQAAENSRLITRAYEVGEVEFASVQRAQLQAKLSLQQRHTEELQFAQVVFELMIDAHEIWGLAHN